MRVDDGHSGAGADVPQLRDRTPLRRAPERAQSRHGKVEGDAAVAEEREVIAAEEYRPQRQVEVFLIAVEIEAEIDRIRRAELQGLSFELDAVLNAVNDRLHGGAAEGIDSLGKRLVRFANRLVRSLGVVEPFRDDLADAVAVDV